MEPCEEPTIYRAQSKASFKDEITKQEQCFIFTAGRRQQHYIKYYVFNFAPISKIYIFLPLMLVVSSSFHLYISVPFLHC